MRQLIRVDRAMAFASSYFVKISVLSIYLPPTFLPCPPSAPLSPHRPSTHPRRGNHILEDQGLQAERGLRSTPVPAGEKGRARISSALLDAMEGYGSGVVCPLVRTSPVTMERAVRVLFVYGSDTRPIGPTQASRSSPPHVRCTSLTSPFSSLSTSPRSLAPRPQVLKVLEQAQSTYMASFQRLSKEVFTARLEANDNRCGGSEWRRDVADEQERKRMCW